jgi:hypothetical protein
MWRQSVAVFAAIVFLSATAGAQGVSVYTADNGYMIEVVVQGDTMEVHEPANGKRSQYRRQSDGLYYFTNPTNGITYTMEIRDQSSLIANKPGAPAANGTLLRLRGTAGAAEPMDDDEQEELAAMARAQGGGSSQVLQAAVALRSLVNAGANPCSDAIPDSVWSQTR